MKIIDNDKRKRIAQFVPMLSSDLPGDVVAAATAIGRALKAGGYDWHDLAGLVATPLPLTPLGERVEEAIKRRRRKRDGVLSGELLDVITSIVGRKNDPVDLLGDFAGGFIEQLRNRAEKYETVRLTPKQDRWLRNLAQAAGADVPWDEVH